MKFRGTLRRRVRFGSCVDGSELARALVGKGKDAVHLRDTDEGLMHRGHDLWLATLKWVSEGK
jgi:hypothetical protein